MFRPAARSLLRSSTSARSAVQFRAGGRRFASTAPPHEKSRSWKNSALRWGVAVAGVYWYNTSSVFAEEPAYPATRIPVASEEDESLPTIDDIAAARKARLAASTPSTSSLSSPAETPSSSTAASTVSLAPGTSIPGSGVGELEEEAEGEGAFNPETGEINWDCPCLGGMAHGPCGEEFRAAFSCFVFSKEEPKGMDCIDKFRGMQDCFRKYPEVYGEELAGDEDEAEPAPLDQPAPAHASTRATETPLPTAATSAIEPPSSSSSTESEAAPAPTTSEGTPATMRQSAGETIAKQEPPSETDDLGPKAWHDNREDNQKKSA